jgi:hypothetical protein
LDESLVKYATGKEAVALGRSRNAKLWAADDSIPEQVPPDEWEAGGADLEIRGSCLFLNNVTYSPPPYGGGSSDLVRRGVSAVAGWSLEEKARARRTRWRRRSAKRQLGPPRGDRAERRGK